MLYQGDNMAILPTIADKSIDLTVTSPPYDNLRTYNGNSQFDFEGIAKELLRVTKDGGVVVWVVGDATINGSETGTSFKQALFFKDIGFNLHDTMIYHKPYVPLTHNRYEQGFEYMFVFARPGKKVICNHLMVDRKYPDKRTHKMYGRRNKGSGDVIDWGYAKQSDKVIKDNVWMLNNRTDQSTGHPAPFPLQLATDHILSWSNEGDTVLDPFAGSGTTGVACLNTGRKFILIEKDESYCEIIKNRIDNHQPLLQAINE